MRILFTIGYQCCTFTIENICATGGFSVSDDISGILRNWEFDPENPIRIITGKDGREVLQVRQPLGIEQYEMDGRPDGKRPFGKESFLEMVQERLSQHILNHANDSEFNISHEDFLIMQNEGILFYYRYLQLFQVGDFERTARDTNHNLQICELVEKYCEDQEDPKIILQYKPYILRMHAISDAMLSLHRNLKTIAKQTLESAITTINEMSDIDTPAFKFEKIRSLSYLKSALQQIGNNAGSSASGPLDKLRGELEVAVEEEDYERAAQLRDRLNEIGKDKD